ncbi:MAG: hypothetical protein JXB30_12565 [Anaerolineae bacterium]|nr:hypothetical protein [Anaerolineae bacterium]
MLTEILHHGRTSESLLLDTRLVIRESCGCLPLAARASKSPAPSVPVNLSENTLAQQRDVVLAEIREVICNHFTDVTPEAIEEVVDAFVEEVKGRSADRFIPLFSDLLRAATTTISRTQLEAGIITKWQDMLSVLHAKVLPYKHPNVAADIEGLLHQAYILITQMAERAHSNLQVQAEASILIQSEAVRDINAASNIQQVVDVLAQSLPRLGIRTCALALYEGEPIPPQFSRLIMACDDGKRLELDPGGCLFPSEQLIPPGILPDGKLPILEVRPLVSRDTHVGFILMEMIAGHRTMCDTYEELAEQIGSAMHKALLLQQIRQSNQDLQQRAAEMVEANIQLEQFAHIVSHDLQEPLRMVAGYLELLERRYKDRLDADAREFIGYAIGGAKRMKRMIDDLLAYSRVVTNGQPLAPVDCELLIAQILSNLEVAIKEHNAVITQDPLPHVVADGTQLMGVFQNLIGNALKFHADRQPRVHISAERRGEEWVFSVCDNGIGIAPEYIERIFVIFSRLHTQAEYPGTGIGLAICKKVIERHGGRIWVESRPGEGSTFFFTLPVRSSGTTTSHLT